MSVTDADPEAPGARPLRILFVAQHLPVPVRGGSAQRSHLLIEMLGRLGTVEIAAIGGAPLKPHLEAFGYTVAGILPPASESLPARLSRVLLPAARRYSADPAAAALLRTLWKDGRYDVVVGRYLGPSARAGVHLLPCAIVDVDDLESQKLTSWAKGYGIGAIIRPLAERMAAVERRIIGKLRRAWVSAPEDADALCDATAIDLVPNIPFQAPERLGSSPESGTILFVASFDYRVNADALRAFARQQWPAIRARHPDALLRVVGGGIEGTLRAELERVEGVDLAGFVDNLAAEYARAMFSIVPIWEGGGTKIKILESLAFGRTCVVAAPSMRGYGALLPDGEALLVADKDADFVDAVDRLIDDAATRHRIEEAGHAAVQQHYSRERLSAAVRDSVLSAISSVEQTA